MTIRRYTFVWILVSALTMVVCLPLVVFSAPPQFNPYWTYSSRVLSPFPGFDPKFISSITPVEYVSLAKAQRGMPYEITYDYPQFSITYTRRIRNNVMMVPVTDALDAFVNRRIELSTQSTLFDITRQSLMKEQKKKAGGIFSILLPIRSRAFESIFGEGGAGLKVSGYRKISFSGRSTWTDKQETAFNRQSKFPTLQMEQVYRFDIEGSIGSKISVKVSQDSRNDIPLANRLILRYKGAEDDVLQSVEAGNTTLNLPSTQFLAYSTRVQGLFGIKATAQIADVSITAIASQEKGSTETVEINAGSSSMSTNIIRDVEYRKRTIYDLGRLPASLLSRARSDALPAPAKYDFAPGDSIRRILVFIDDMNNDQAIRLTRTEGICYIDPEDTLSDDPTSIYRTSGFFDALSADSFYVATTDDIQSGRPGFYLQFLDPIIGSSDIIGVYMEVNRVNGTIDTIGDVSATPYRLKLIKPQYYTTVNHHVWEYEWKNVYTLGGQNLDLNAIDINVYKGAPVGTSDRRVNPEDLDHQNGTKYLQILGLDQGDDNGNGAPNGEVDKRVYIDAGNGLLFFPNRHPFDSPFSYTRSSDSQPIYLSDSVPEIYLNAQQTTTTSASKYYIAITSKGRGNASILLNATNIIEGSEVVKYGDQRLTKGVDYDIDYDFGRLTLLKDQYTDLNSNLSVMFETAPFFSLAQKTLLGTRLEYASGTDFKLGTTLLYKSDKSTNRKPKIGEETSKMLVWDADLSYRFEMPLFTTLTNALPFVTGTTPSYVQLSAEVAQSRPNPNVDGKVFIDDFEGAKDSYSLGISRTTWRHTSRPAVIDATESERGHIAWYNPIEDIPDTVIWNREPGQGEINSTHVMSIMYRPVNFKRYPDTIQHIIDTTSFPISPEKSWEGFMRDIPLGAAEQLKSVQLLEMRLNGNAGILHIDLGRISEDVNGNGKDDTEDKDGFGVLDDNEDVGLDGLPDSLEFGYNPAAGVTDPAGDNFSLDAPYLRINGTEGNRDDPDGGWIPDAENPNKDAFGNVNSYFSYKIDLSDTTDYYRGFYVDSSRNRYDWRTIRIPLRDPEAIDTVVGSASWDNIWYARIWIDSAGVSNLTTPLTINIASIELLSTTWADSFYIADSLRSGRATFDVAVINDEVDGRYVPPPGVEGYYDPTREARELEQSLLLTFDSLNAAVPVYSPDSGIVLAADTGLAVRKMYRANNLMGYGKLEAYVHGGIRNSDSVRFFFRLGYDKDAYYEYRTILKPGWDPANSVLIDFNEISGLKARLLNDREEGRDSSLVRIDETGKYLIKIKPSGQDPSLTRIQYFSMGVVNLDPSHTAGGDVWVDELRLTNVRDDVGLAARVGISGNMSDLITYSFGYSSQDAYYRGVSSATKGGAADNLGSGQTRTNYTFSGSFKLDKLLPRSLEAQLPVTVNWSQNVTEPLLRSGTDIIVPQDLKREETSVTLSKGFRISESFSKKTKNPLFTVFLNRLSTKFNYNVTEGHSPTQPMFLNERYDAGGSFDLSARKPPSLTPLTWMKLLKVPFGLPGTRLYLYPTRLDFSGDLSGTYSKSVNRNNVNPVSSRLDFRGGLNSNFKVFECLSGAYSFTTNRDLRDPKTVNVTFNPKKFRLGVEQNYSQNFRADYGPSIFSFLTHKVGYSATYSDTYRGGRDSVFYHSANSRVATDLSMTFKHQDLIGSNKRNSRERGKQQPADTTASFFNAFKVVLTGIRYVTDAIDPVSAKIGTSRTIDYSGLADKASMPFRFGLTEDPGVDQVRTSSTTSRQGKTVSKTFSANSGVSLFAGISVDVSYGRDTRENFSESYPSKTISVDWPELQFNLRSIRGLWYVGKILNSLSPSSHYGRSKETKLHKGAAGPFEINTRESFSPLISFTINPLRTMRSTVKYQLSSSTNTKITETTGQTTNVTKRGERDFTFSWSYSFRSPTGVRLPLFGRVKFESNLSVSLDVSVDKNKGESANANTNFEFETTEEKSSLTVRPGASYSFSSTVKGGLTGRWQDSNDVRTRRKTHTREIGIWVELTF